MPIATSAAAARIARNLREAELKTDAALLATSELMSSLLIARENPELTRHTGQESLIRLAKAQMSILEGSTGIFRVHESVAKIGVELGILDEPEATRPLGIAEDAARFAA